MNETPKPPPEARPSASVLLLRDAEPSLEVFMVQRHHQIDFATGAMVFPGGKVEPSDRDPRIRSRARHDGRLDDEAIAYLAAAVRETFEESGVLLAYERNSHEPVGAARIPDMDRRPILHAQRFDIPAQHVRHRSTGLHEDRIRGAPAERLEAQAPGARIEVEHPRPDHPGTGHAKQRLPHPIGCRTHRFSGRHTQPRTPVLAADYSHVAWCTTASRSGSRRRLVRPPP